MKVIEHCQKIENNILIGDSTMSLETKNVGWVTDIRGNLVTPDPNRFKYCYLSLKQALHYLHFGYPGNIQAACYNAGDLISCKLRNSEEIKGEVLGYVAKVKEGVQIVVETQDGIKYVSTNDIASYIKE